MAEFYAHCTHCPQPDGYPRVWVTEIFGTPAARNEWATDHYDRYGHRTLHTHRMPDGDLSWPATFPPIAGGTR